MTDVAGRGRALRRVVAGLALLGAWAAGCDSSEIETTTRNIDRGLDVALLCAVSETDTAGRTTWAGVPAARCAEAGDGELFAFVVQSTRGELAAVNLRSLRMLDLDPREPLHSPVAVGPLPNSVAAAPDGSWVVVANLGDPNPEDEPGNPEGRPYLSVLRPEWVLPQRTREAERIFLPVPAAVVAFLDPTHVLATLPALSAVTVVTLGDEPEVAEPVVLEPFPLLDPEGLPQDGLATPWSVLVDAGRRRILVGDRNAARLATLRWDDDFALTVTGLAQLPGPVPSLDLEPAGWGPEGDEPGRWIYAVDGRSGGVMVLDAETLVPLDLAARDPLEWRSELFVPGLAQDVVVGRVAFEEPPTTPEPEVLHGTFAFLVASVGEVYVVDIEDRSDPGCWSGTAAGLGDYREDVCPRHVLRSAAAPPAPPAIGTEPAQVPYWSSAPTLQLAGGSTVSYDDEPPAPFPRFADFAEADPWGNDTYGVFFDPDPRRAVSQRWSIEYEGVLPYTDGTAGNVESDGWLTDRGMAFCAVGVLAGDRLTLLDAPEPLDPASAACRGYGGADDGELREYRIVEALADRVRLEALPGKAPLPTEECYPWAVRYEVRVSGQWLVQGEGVPFQHRVIAEGGACVEEPDEAGCPPLASCDELPEGYPFRCLNQARAREGVVFRNPWICFTLEAGSEPTARGMRWELRASGGFEPLLAEVGSLPVAAVLDDTTRTGPALLVLDSSVDGLSRIDLDGFEVSDYWP